MACRSKMCKYYKNCIVRDANDGSGCDDYEKSTNLGLKKKKRYTDDEVNRAMMFARQYLTYSQMQWANIYIYQVPNIEIINHLEEVLNSTVKKSLFDW